MKIFFRISSMKYLKKILFYWNECLFKSLYSNLSAIFIVPKKLLRGRNLSRTEWVWSIWCIGVNFKSKRRSLADDLITTILLCLVSSICPLWGVQCRYEQHQFILPYMLPYSISFTTVLEPYPISAWLGTAQKLDHVNYTW